MFFPHRHVLGLRFWTAQDINCVLEQARSLKEVLSRPTKQVPTLRGKNLLLLFFEPSTRTKLSFDMAIKLMGAGSVSVTMESSSVKKGESLADTVRNIQAMGIDGVVIRHKHGGAPHFISKCLNIPVINAGDGFHEHPTQGLLDVFTMIEHRGDIQGKNVLICGDILHSRVARSNIWALTKLGANVYVSGPPTLLPDGLDKMGVTLVHNLDTALPQMDIINVLRVQYERQAMGYFPSVRDYRRLYGITKARMALAKPDALVLHPGPMNRGIEIDSEVADGPHNVILDQVTNGIAVRMAVLYLLFSQQEGEFSPL
jgi:aspartate carbamoyltransferase catalytic subunit